MPKEIFPSSYECDCGHQSHFFENTVREMEVDSRRGRKLIHLLDSEAFAVICPKLGRRRIMGWT